MNIIKIYEDKACTKLLENFKFGQNITLKLFDGNERLFENVVDINKPIMMRVYLKNESERDEYVIQDISSNVKGFKFNIFKSNLQPNEVMSLDISHTNTEQFIALTRSGISPEIRIKGVFVIRSD